VTETPATTLAAIAPAVIDVRRGRPLVHVPCNHCGHEVTHNVHNVSRLVRCVNCGLIFVNPRPAFEELARQYEGSYFNCPEPTFGGYEDYEADRDQILRTFKGRLRQLRRFVPAPSPLLLDVGCATGIFLEAAREAGWRGEGVDISEYALTRARAKGLTVRSGTLIQAGLAGETYDVITMWDLIEHVPDPAAVLAECRRLLKPGGVLALSTPDAGSLPARVLRGRWLGFRSIDEHLYFFSRLTMSAMLKTAGFEVLGDYPMGKYLTLPRLIERMRFYSRIASRLLRAVDRVLPRISIYVNSFDTMVVVATRKPD
jgi:2-polyprenyl-3-methyl-5-hydroxy-6-metoxy-1,4-benzoquinol methylase/ribosomal protein S27E